MSEIVATINGRTYRLDPETVTAREYRVLKRHTASPARPDGLPVTEFWRSMGDIDVMDGVRWLMLSRAGQQVDIDDDYVPLQFVGSFAVAEDEEDPKAGGSTPPPSNGDASIPIDSTVISGN